jgi:hypothetical protein
VTGSSDYRRAWAPWVPYRVGSAFDQPPPGRAAAWPDHADPSRFVPLAWRPRRRPAVVPLQCRRSAEDPRGGPPGVAGSKRQGAYTASQGRGNASIASSSRFRCRQCGNLTRFDVVESRRSRAYYHFTIEGDLRVEDEEVLSAERERVTCRWCGSSEDIEEIPVDG